MLRIQIYALMALIVALPSKAEEGKDGPCTHCKPLGISVRGAAAAATSPVSVKNFAYGTDPLTINVGDTVTWTNNDTASHSATGDTQLFDTGVLSPGQSGSFTFNTAGNFPYHCTVHSFMHGTVIVQGSSAPVLTKLTAVAKVGAPFTYTITASGTQPITFGATVPAGLTLNGAVISGTFTAAGTITIPLTATNSLGTDSKNLVVSVSSAAGGNDLTGTWVGSLKSAHFNQTAPAQKTETDNLTLAITQSAGELTALVTVSGGTNATISASGLAGNTNLWLNGTSAVLTIVLSGHVDKKGATMKGIAILYAPDGEQQITFSAKKQ